MAKFIAFLRGINLGSYNKIPMKELENFFAEVNCKNVSAYLQTGNVIFETEENKLEKISAKVDKSLEEFTGNKIPMTIRKFEDLKNIDKEITKIEIKKYDQLYVTFLHEIPDEVFEVPFRSPKEDLTIIKFGKDYIISFSHKVKGRYGYPSNLIEKKLKVAATTRNAKVIKKILNKYS